MLKLAGSIILSTLSLGAGLAGSFDVATYLSWAATCLLFGWIIDGD